MQNEDEILDAKEVGVIVKLHERSIHRMSERGELTVCESGLTLRCSRAALLRKFDPQRTDEAITNEQREASPSDLLYVKEVVGRTSQDRNAPARAQ